MRFLFPNGVRCATWQAAALLAAIMLATGCAHQTRHATPANPYRIVGYDTVHGSIRPADVDRIDTLVFAFAKLVDGEVVLDAAATQRLHQLTALKADHPRLRVVVSVGGWGAGGFSEAAANAAGRQRFADSAVQLLLANHADGLDVDWEYPGHDAAGITASAHDRDNFTRLLIGLRSALDAASAAHGDHYTLSIAVGDGPLVSGVDIAAVNPSVDWFNLMTYDFVNSMTPTTGHHTGLHASARAPVDGRTTARAVRQFRAAGVPARKLLIGAAFYGREFAGVEPDAHGLHQRYAHYQGEHPWPQLKADFINKQGYVRYWDDAAQAPWLWNATTRHFITYDDPQSLTAKAAWVKAQGLGGIMYWQQEQDPQGELLDALWRGLR